MGVLWIIQSAQCSVLQRGPRSAWLTVRSRGCLYMLIGLMYAVQMQDRTGDEQASRVYCYLVCGGARYVSEDGRWRCGNAVVCQMRVESSVMPEYLY